MSYLKDSLIVAANVLIGSRYFQCKIECLRRMLCNADDKTKKNGIQSVEGSEDWADYGINKNTLKKYASVVSLQPNPMINIDKMPCLYGANYSKGHGICHLNVCKRTRAKLSLRRGLWTRNKFSTLNEI